MRIPVMVLGPTMMVSLLAGCNKLDPTEPMVSSRGGVSSEVSNSPKKLDIGICAPTHGGFTIVGTNPYFPMDVGRLLILRGEDEGDEIELQVHVLDETRLIANVLTRVVEEREFVNGELSEVTWNYHVQASDGGTICYYGEDVDIYGPGGITHEGAWCAATFPNQAGIFMPKDPQPGMTYPNEVAFPIAADEATIVGQGPFEVPFAKFLETIRIREFDPITADKDYKIHAAGTGIIVDGVLTLREVNFTSGTPPVPTIQSPVCGT